VHTATFLVLEARIYVFVDGLALDFPLGLDDFVAIVFVASFSTGSFHHASQSLTI